MGGCSKTTSQILHLLFSIVMSRFAQTAAESAETPWPRGLESGRGRSARIASTGGAGFLPPPSGISRQLLHNDPIALNVVELELDRCGRLWQLARRAARPARESPPWRAAGRRASAGSSAWRALRVCPWRYGDGAASQRWLLHNLFRARRRLVGGRWQARFDEAGRMGTRTRQHIGA
jgi:hypothetical protein